MRSRLFWKIYLTYGFVFLVATAILTVVACYRVEKSFMEWMRQEVRERAALILPQALAVLDDNVLVNGNLALNPSPTEPVEKRLSFSVVDAQGKTVAGKQEVQFRKTLFGNVEKYEIDSNLAEGKLELNYSLPVEADEAILGYVLVQTQLSPMISQVNSIQRTIVFAALLGLLIVLIVGWIVVKRITLPLVEMHQVADAMCNANYSARVKTIPQDELGKLGTTMNRLGQELEVRSATMRQERAQLEAMFTGMVEGIIAVDNENNILFNNRAVYRLFDSTLGDMRGHTLEDLEGFKQLTTVVNECRSNNKRANQELKMRHNGAIKKILEIHATPFSGEQNSGVMIVLNDITEVRLLEKVRQDFVANVSHEIKTPLTSIKGYVETLLTDEVQDTVNVKRFLGKVDKNVDRLVHLVQDILSLARIENEEDSLPLQEIDLSKIASEVISRHEGVMKAKSIRMISKIQSRVVLACRESVIQVVDNLLDNAIKYTPDKGTIWVEIDDNNQGGTTLSVRDTGIGIPKKHLNRIFERFYRVDKARSRSVGGTGLGLSIVKHLVAGMQGQVWVESEVGYGSQFSVQLNNPQ